MTTYQEQRTILAKLAADVALAADSARALANVATRAALDEDDYLLDSPTPSQAVAESKRLDDLAHWYRRCLVDASKPLASGPSTRLLQACAEEGAKVRELYNCEECGAVGSFLGKWTGESVDSPLPMVRYLCQPCTLKQDEPEGEA